jgi:integrase
MSGAVLFCEEAKPAVLLREVREPSGTGGEAPLGGQASSGIEKKEEVAMAIYKRGDVYWFSFVFDGRRIQRSTKQGNRKAAIDMEAAERTALAKGEAGIAPPKRERRTVGELLDAMEESYKQENRFSAQNESLISRTRDDFGSKMAKELTTEHVEQYIRRRQNEGAKNSSINRVTEILRRAYTLANEKAKKAKEQELKIPHIERLPENNTRQGFFSEAELTSLIAALPENLQDFVRFAAACGMRKGEIAGLTWKMVEGDELRIPKELCKNGKARILPLSGELSEIIDRRRATLSREKNGTVQMPEFIFHRGGSQVAEIRKSWQTAAVAVGLGIMVCDTCGAKGPEKYCKKCKTPRRYEGKLFHDLRRTAVRNMVKAGVNTQVAKRWSGHTSDSMFERYSILTTDDMREAQKRTEEYRQSQREKVVAIAK